MGHAEGICHVYVDSEADPQKAASVVVDAKVDYPAGIFKICLLSHHLACNAMETLLLHRETLQNGVADTVLSALRSAGVEILGYIMELPKGVSHFSGVRNAFALVLSFDMLKILVTNIAISLFLLKLWIMLMVRSRIFINTGGIIVLHSNLMHVVPIPIQLLPKMFKPQRNFFKKWIVPVYSTMHLLALQMDTGLTSFRLI